MHLQAICHQPLNSNIVRPVKPKQATIQFGLWAAADDVKHCLTIAAKLTFVTCCKASLFVAGSGVTLVSPEIVYS